MRAITSLLIYSMLLTVCLASGTSELTVCYNFGCKTQASVGLSRSDVAELAKLFNAVKSAKEERERIGAAIARMEQFVARTIPTGNDVGGNFREGVVEDGQQDCIDESINTTAYLSFFKAQGWLTRHAVQERVRRATFFVNDHWAAVIRDLDTGQLYVVDSWFNDNGQPPVIQKLESWQKNTSKCG